MLRQGPGAASGRTVLSAHSVISIIDDDASVRSATNNLLRSHGYAVHTFASAEAFLNSNQVRDTACLILDVRMAGMNGLELQRQLGAAHWRIPIIFVTAYADDDTRAHALAAGAVAFLSKPCREEDLLKAIEAALKPS